MANLVIFEERDDPSERQGAWYMGTHTFFVTKVYGKGVESGQEREACGEPVCERNSRSLGGEHTQERTSLGLCSVDRCYSYIRETLHCSVPAPFQLCLVGIELNIPDLRTSGTVAV